MRDAAAQPLSPGLRGLLAHPPAHAAAVDEALAEVYGTPEWRPDGDPLGGLVGTILSQNTSDVNSGRAYDALRQQFPTWEAVREAAPEEIATAIRSGGLAQIKAMRIKEALLEITSQFGGLRLDALAAMSPSQAREYLAGLHGVGPKTASCVLLFNLGRPAFPVDTHVHRLSRRIGFVQPRASPRAVQDTVEAMLPPDRLYPFHINLIRHGRTVCRAQAPRCPTCPIRALCRHGTLGQAE
jgi:endonuclease-3